MSGLQGSEYCWVLWCQIPYKAWGPCIFSWCFLKCMLHSMIFEHFCPLHFCSFLNFPVPLFWNWCFTRLPCSMSQSSFLAWFIEWNNQRLSCWFLFQARLFWLEQRLAAISCGIVYNSIALYLTLFSFQVRDETYTAFENIYAVLTKFRKVQQWYVASEYIFIGYSYVMSKYEMYISFHW